jgi:hypothetical protein
MKLREELNAARGLWRTLTFYGGFEYLIVLIIITALTRGRHMAASPGRLTSRLSSGHPAQFARGFAAATAAR